MANSALSPTRAVLVGHLVVTAPVLAIIIGVSIIGYHRLGRLSIIVGSLLAWPWWSLAVPR